MLLDFSWKMLSFSMYPVSTLTTLALPKVILLLFWSDAHCLQQVNPSTLGSQTETHAHTHRHKDTGMHTETGIGTDM